MNDTVDCSMSWDGLAAEVTMSMLIILILSCLCIPAPSLFCQFLAHLSLVVVISKEIEMEMVIVCKICNIVFLNLFSDCHFCWVVDVAISFCGRNDQISVQKNNVLYVMLQLNCLDLLCLSGVIVVLIKKPMF